MAVPRFVTPSFETQFDQTAPTAADPHPPPPAGDPQDPPEPPAKDPGGSRGKPRKDPPPPSHPDQPSRPEVDDPPAPGVADDAEIIARRRHSCLPSGVRLRHEGDPGE